MGNIKRLLLVFACSQCEMHNIFMAWRHLLEVFIHNAAFRNVAKGSIRALVIGVIFYFVVYLLERASGGATAQYRSRGFLQDVAYWFYYRSGLNQLVVMAALFSFLGTNLLCMELKIVGGLPSIMRGVLLLLLADFSSYWVHRLQHASRFVWAFHSTHHAQEQLNFATTTRFHPVDHFISDALKFIPLLLLGTSPMTWVPLYLAMDLLAITQHSRITWSFGVLSQVLVTPRFHAFHHLVNSNHYDKNSEPLPSGTICLDSQWTLPSSPGSLGCRMSRCRL